MATQQGSPNNETRPSGPAVISRGNSDEPAASSTHDRPVPSGPVFYQSSRDTIWGLRIPGLLLILLALMMLILYAISHWLPILNAMTSNAPQTARNQVLFLASVTNNSISVFSILVAISAAGAGMVYLTSLRSGLRVNTKGLQWWHFQGYALFVVGAAAMVSTVAQLLLGPQNIINQPFWDAATVLNMGMMVAAGILFIAGYVRGRKARKARKACNGRRFTIGFLFLLTTTSMILINTQTAFDLSAHLADVMALQNLLNGAEPEFVAVLRNALPVMVYYITLMLLGTSLTHDARFHD